MGRQTDIVDKVPRAPGGGGGGGGGGPGGPKDRATMSVCVKGGVFFSFYFFSFFWVLPPFLGGGWSGVATG